ncbi:hypothetical protein D3C84_1090740 [compost metagenome]
MFQNYYRNRLLLSMYWYKFRHLNKFEKLQTDRLLLQYLQHSYRINQLLLEIRLAPMPKLVYCYILLFYLKMLFVLSKLEQKCLVQ